MMTTSRSETEVLQRRLEYAEGYIKSLRQRVHELESERYRWTTSALRYTTATAENDVPFQTRIMDIRIRPFRVMVPWASMERSRKEREKDLRRCALALTRHFMADLRQEIVG